MPIDSYLPVLIFIFLGLVVVALFYLPAVLMGPKGPTEVKRDPFECGNEPSGEPTVALNPRFYQVAILFLVFDVEIAFLYPWAMVYLDVGRTGLVSMGVFIVVLFAALVYVVRKRVLGWI